METTEILSYCIAAFSGLRDAVERYPELKADLNLRTETQRNDSEGECSQEAIVSPDPSDVNQNNGCTAAPNPDSGFHQDSIREVTAYSSTTSSPQFYHQSAISTYHRPGVAETSPNNFLPNTPSICQHRSAFSPYVRPPGYHITGQGNAANGELIVNSSQLDFSSFQYLETILRE